MMTRIIEPLNLTDLEDDEIRDLKEKALKDIIELWEKHGSLLLTQSIYKGINQYYALALEQLRWLEGENF